VVIAAMGLHVRAAVLRSSGLLEHDESIALLAAAGKSKSAELFYESPDGVRTLRAGDVQSLLKPTGTGWRDVIASLESYDIHPPLYFWLLHGLQRLGIDSQVLLRLFGTLIAALGVWCANRYVWPDASGPGKLLGSIWLMACPACVEIATELRQYSLVYLGTMISIAAFLRAWEFRRDDRRAVWLLALSPVILLYSHFGAIVWIGPGFCLVLPWIIANWSRSRSIMLAPGMLIVLALAPLMLWWHSAAGSVGPAPAIPLSQMMSEVFEPIGAGLGWAWLSWPARWAAWRPELYAAVAIFWVCVVLARRVRARGDRMLFIMVFVWAACWTTLLAVGKIPPHAVSTKYLAPLVLVTLVLIVRGTQQIAASWMRRLALLVLGASLVTHVVGVRHIWQRSTSEPLVRELGRADALIINSPRRGYLLPLAAAMKPDARIVIASPTAALARWEDLRKTFPTDGVLLVEVFQERTGPALKLFDRLRQTYGAAEPLRSERARLITKLSRPAESEAK
jgi:hypothetical protein